MGKFTLTVLSKFCQPTVTLDSLLTLCTIGMKTKELFAQPMVTEQKQKLYGYRSCLSYIIDTPISSSLLHANVDIS